MALEVMSVIINYGELANHISQRIPSFWLTQDGSIPFCSAEAGAFESECEPNLLPPAAK